MQQQRKRARRSPEPGAGQPPPRVASARQAPDPVRWIVAGLGLLALLVFGHVLGHDFIDYDDPKYVVENPVVRAGLTGRGVAWAFTTEHAANWHPVTWLSHMLDCQLFGVQPEFHHATSLFLHTANGVLWFLLWRAMTGAVWRSAVVAALFAVHPAHVESVAWIAERKDVLSTFFWVASLWWYVRWVRRGNALAYALALLAGALGLMAKPMVVTLPLTLLLLDRWPLARWPSAWNPGVRLVVEKAPFVAMAAAVSVVTFLVQRAGGAIDVRIPLLLRIANAFVAYVTYVGMAIWPTRLAVYYPLPASLPTWQPIAAALALVVATAVVVRSARPYLVTGWLWYLVTLLPVIGFVQIGGRALADRYTYVPYIGLFVMAAWGIAELAERWKARATVVPVGAGAALAAYAVVAWVQLGFWQDSVTLFRHALAVTADNFVAEANLGVALQDAGDLDGASVHLEASYALNPDGDAAFNLGNVRFAQGRLPEAVALYEEALQEDPRRVKTLYNLANALRERGDPDGAVQRYREALGLDPTDVDVRNNLGITLLNAGRLDEAGTELDAARNLAPDDKTVHRNLAVLAMRREDWNRAVAEYQIVHQTMDDPDLIDELVTALESAGRPAEAAATLEHALARSPDEPRFLGGLAWLWATSKDDSIRDGPNAVVLAERACAADRTPDCLDTLAAAYAEAGRFDDAVRTVRAAMEHADATPEFRDEVRARAALYEAGRPYRVP